MKRIIAIVFAILVLGLIIIFKPSGKTSPKGIGGAADDGSNPPSDVPGAAYGDTSRGKELPTGTGEINPATGRAYVPSDFASAATAAPTAGSITG